MIIRNLYFMFHSSNILGVIITTEVIDTTTDASQLPETTTEVTDTTISSNNINEGHYFITKFMITP